MEFSDIPPGGPPPTSWWERLDDIDTDIIGLTGEVRRVATGLEEIRADLDGVEARAAQLASDTESADELPPLPGPEANEPEGSGPEDSEAAEGPPPLDMRILVAWVRDHLALVFQRKIPQNSAPHWCRQWWQHPEAIVRFEALRRAWMASVAEPGAEMANYLILVDQHLAVLMGEHGPFTGCTGGQHRPDSQSRYLGQDDPGEAYYLALEAADHPRPEAVA